MKILLLLLISVSAFGQDFAWNHPNRKHYQELFSQASIEAPACACDFTIPSSAYYVDINKNTNANAYVITPKPGQTVCFAAGLRADLEIHNIVGAAGQPITFRSCGGTIFSAGQGKHMLQFSNSAFIRVIGDNGDGYGAIEITGGGHGLSVQQLSTDFDVQFINFHDLGYLAFEAKTDPTCDSRTWRGNFIMRNIIFRNNTIRNCLDGEGVYIGQSHYNATGAIQGGPCASGITQAKEHEVVGVTVENNIIDGTGADGIQVGSCPSGASIQHNQLSNNGLKNGRGQNAGIITNPGTTGEVAYNTVIGGTGFSIQMQGPGGTNAHHNLIVNPAMGAFFAAVYPVAGLTGIPDYQIYNNTIVNIKGVALQYYSPVIFKNNVLNLVTGATTYKNDGGTAGKLTESGNRLLSSLSGFDANYVPLTATMLPAGVGYADYQKPKPVVVKEAGTVELITTDGIQEWFLVTPSGQRKKIN